MAATMVNHTAWHSRGEASGGTDGNSRHGLKGCQIVLLFGSPVANVVQNE